MAEIQFNQGYENLTDNQKREFDGVMGMGGFNERYQANPESTLVTSDPDYAAFAPISKAYQESETVNDGFNWGSLIGMGSADASEIPQNNYGLQTQAARPFTMGGITLNADGSLNYNNQSPNLGFRSMVDMANNVNNFTNQFASPGRFSGMGQMGPVKSNMNAPTALDMGKFAGIAGLGVANEPDVEQVAQLGNPSMMRGLRNKIGSEFNKAKDGIMGSKAMDFFRGLPTPTNMLLNMAATRNPLNPRASNYNIALQSQIDTMKDNPFGTGTGYGITDKSGLGKITSGRLTGKNLVSMFGSNDLGTMYAKDLDSLEESLAKTVAKQFGRWAIDNPEAYAKKIKKQKEKIAQNKFEQQQIENAARAKTTQMAAANKAAGRGGYQSSFGGDSGFMGGSGTAAEMGSFRDGGLASMFTRRR